MTNILQKQRLQVSTAGPPTANGQRSYMVSTAQENMVSVQGSSVMPNTALAARRSLNRDARKRELMKITKENQMILKRL